MLEHTSIVVICNFCQQLQMQYDNGMIEYSDSSNTKQNPQFFFLFFLYIKELVYQKEEQSRFVLRQASLLSDLLESLFPKTLFLWFQHRKASMVEKRKMISKIVEQLDKTIQLLTHIYIEFILTHYFYLRKNNLARNSSCSTSGRIWYRKWRQCTAVWLFHVNLGNLKICCYIFRNFFHRNTNSVLFSCKMYMLY